MFFKFKFFKYSINNLPWPIFWNFLITPIEIISQSLLFKENSRKPIIFFSKTNLINLKSLDKEKEISEDEERQGEELIQKLTDSYVEKVDLALEAKEKDLLDF